MGYWGHRPPPVARDGPESTKTKRKEMAVKSVGGAAKEKEKETEKTKKKRKKSTSESVGGAEKEKEKETEKTENKRKKPTSESVGGAKKEKKKDTKKSTSEKILRGEKRNSRESGDDDGSDRGQHRPWQPAKERHFSESDSSDSSSDRETDRKVVSTKSDSEPSRQRGGGGKEQKIPPKFLLYGRHLSVPISVGDDAERDYLGKIMKHNIELDQLLVFFKEDGESLWYDKDEVK